MDDNSFEGATEALRVPSPSNKEGTSSEPPSPLNEHQSTLPPRRSSRNKKIRKRYIEEI